MRRHLHRAISFAPGEEKSQLSVLSLKDRRRSAISPEPGLERRKDAFQCSLGGSGSCWKRGGAQRRPVRVGIWSSI